MKRNFYTFLRFLFLFAFVFFITLIYIGCAPTRSVERVSETTVLDLTGRWNDTDARLVAEAMVSDMLSRPWLDEFIKEKRRPPVVTVGYVKNMSTEHVDMEIFIADIERELINSGKVRFVASAGQREFIRREREEQQIYASLETAKQLANEVGADFVLMGTFKSIEDRLEGKKVVFYQVDLELIDVEKNLKAWIGTKKIKKFIEMKKYTW